ncbi:MAG: helix-turn-helix domain-containing protein [Nanoarchaeota archaeon]|nr:helix-turn-helix domain-containing protein [Nanoarchaeota archaeon]
MEQDLVRAGLTGNEAKVYFALLKIDQISGSQLSKKIGLDRSVTYNVLDNLIEKGLVSYVIKSGKKFFLASNPENLLNRIKEKESFIKSIIPQLKKIERNQEENRKVEVYEGKDGLKSFNLNLLKSNEIYVLNATGKIFEVLEFYAHHHIKNSKDKIIKIIAIEKAKQTPLTKINAEFKFLPEEYENHATTFIYGNKIAFQIIVEKPLIIIIENKSLSEGYKKIFDLLWKTAKLN